MSSILIKNPLRVATIDDNSREFAGGHIYIDNGIIQSISPKPFTGVADETIDASDMVALPGFINTHHHFFQALTRNIPLMQNAPLFQWLTNHYEIWREITEEAVYASAKCVLTELMKSGTTLTSDHHYLFPEKSNGKLIDAEIRAASELGIRFQPTRGSMSLGKDAGGLPPSDIVQNESDIRKDTKRLIAKYHDTSDGAMTRISLAPCSPFSVTPELMSDTVEIARENNLQIHTHLAETIDEENYCLKQYGKRPADYIDSLGWISENSWFAHSIHLNDKEIAQLGDSGSGISHCPTSNMRLGSGIARIKEMLNHGVNVSLGVDGSASNDSSNMLSEIRNALLISRLREEQYWLTAREVLRIATRGGAETLGRNDTGYLASGKCADLALFSVGSLEYAGSLSDPIAALVFTTRMSPVDYLIINGEIKVRNGECSIIEEKLIKEQNRLSTEMVERAQANTGIEFVKF